MVYGANPETQAGPFSETAENANHLMTHYAQLGVDDWDRVTTQAHSGSRSWYSEDVPNYSDTNLQSPWFHVDSVSAALSFWLYYDLEGDSSQYWDGAVLELRTQNGDWVDIGSQNVGVPYDGQLFDNSTLQFRQAWSGVQTTWRQGTVDLSPYNGEWVQFRFRLACDTSANNPGGGIWVDDIEVTNVTWNLDPSCDLVECTTCFATPGDALNAILQSVDIGEWPDQKTMLDYISTLNDICP